MNKENDILKWFDGDISTAEIKKLYPDEDFSALEKAAFYAKQIDVPKVDAQQALAEFKTRSFKKKESKVIPLNFKSILKVAAILVVMLTSSYFLFFNNTKSYSTAIAQTETFNLPDDSEVILNAQSKLSFNKKTWEKSRSLDLNGEAFFKVTKGEKFIVNTEIGSIQVLGTQFNVKERPNYFEVQCYEGSVSVTHSKEKVVLTPGKSFRVVNNEIVSAKDFNAETPSWLAKESSFDNVPLWQVINELEIQYDITIDASKVDVAKTFSGSFTHTDKNIALQSVTIPLKLSYKINGNKVELYNYDKN
ncbi:FecR family protein [Hwangdonia lutea]|uniref:FecR domain-containing protein n=1 Tax=Hwangdonia lutea TaxID=3075823 RepID=A0AA97HQH6_9FLAO|nr:FecR domain-containing protein [Hwangdonia sp. SCSIO 19198]WOD42945.1 FecR domain-containing protein [Hwangdonia sp. SCSIO 19198]